MKVPGSCGRFIHVLAFDLPQYQVTSKCIDFPQSNKDLVQRIFEFASHESWHLSGSKFISTHFN